LTFHRLISWLPLLPMLRVDYIWHTESLRALQAWVGADAGSDHLPVLAKFSM
jgi:endonuclease/exonuclease/phosphatase (EEP) superfamily protein YafD